MSLPAAGSLFFRASDKSAGSEPAAFIRGLVALNLSGRVALFFRASDKSAGSEPATFIRGLVALNPSGRVAFLPTAAFIINLYPSLLALEVFLIGLILDYMNYSIILLNCEYPKAQQ